MSHSNFRTANNNAPNWVTKSPNILVEEDLKSVEQEKPYTLRTATSNTYTRSEQTSPFERLYTQANTQRMKIEMNRRRLEISESANNTFQPNLTKTTPGSQTLAPVSDHTAT